MFAWIRNHLEIARLAQQRADRLVEECRVLRNLANSRQEEIDRLNKVLDEVSAVVKGWKR